MASEAERLLNGSGWLPEVLRRNDLVALDDEGRAEGQGGMPKWLTASVKLTFLHS